MSEKKYIQMLLIIFLCLNLNCKNSIKNLILNNNTKQKRSVLNFDKQYKKKHFKKKSKDEEIRCERCNNEIENYYDYCLECGWEYVWLGEGTKRILPGTFGHE
ncbi:MAG: hypothetical protein GY830_00490 [Bacteroidetes bacterium]|nr:hypothetical protein [Bacteroidota bacterium]